MIRNRDFERLISPSRRWKSRLIADKVRGLSTSPLVIKVEFRPASVSFLPVHGWSGVEFCAICAGSRIQADEAVRGTARLMS